MGLFKHVVCPTPAYDRLMAAGIDKLISRNRHRLHLFFLYKGYGDEGRLERKAVKALEKPGDNHEFWLDVLRFYDVLDEHGTGYIPDESFGEAVLQHPAALAHVAVSKLPDAHALGFRSIQELETAIASYCLERERDYPDDHNRYTWRLRDKRNDIFHDWNGDFFVGQIDVSGGSRVVRTFWGEETVFDTCGSRDRNGIDGFDNKWRVWLMTLLRYAQAVGCGNMHEIQQWRDIIDEVGAVGTNTAEAYGSSSYFYLQSLKDYLLLRRDEQPQSFPLRIDSHAHGYWYIPYVDGELLRVAATDKDGDVTFGGTRFFEGQRFRNVLDYDKTDLPHLLRGTYRFYARDRGELPRIMDMVLHGKAP